ncbi:hypothetical protein CUZ96_2314 [Enterococcus lactis]|nr:hypothetical protein [Enterococcus lactis]MBL5012647.1 hypothetical protein [Enterococcus lactis]
MNTSASWGILVFSIIDKKYWESLLDQVTTPNIVDSSF